MSCGLVGSHRTGKTTLARLYAKRNGVSFLQTSTSGVMKARGFDPAKDYPLIGRLGIQNVILDVLERGYRDAPVNFITDRTPLDAAAYMLADIQRENADPELQAQVIKYVERCIEVTNRHFGILLVVQPGIKLVEEEGKAPAQVAYMEHIAQLIVGLVNDERISARHYYMPRRVVDLETRVRAMTQAVKKTVQRTEIELLSYVASGMQTH